MKQKFTTLLLVGILAFSLAGCGGIGTKMNRLSINMTKKDVRGLLGGDFQAKASKVDASGNVLDLWEFYDKKDKVTYQIFFLNGKVSQWGRKSDLKAFPELYAPAKKGADNSTNNNGSDNGKAKDKK